MIWDPLRKKEVPLTPEERVRQWFISVLRDKMKVPVQMMMSEVSMKFGTGAVKKSFRADIVVYDRRLKPVIAVECKRPDVELSEKTLEQALRYDMVLDVRFIVITNGRHTFVCRRRAGKLEFITEFPDWQTMLSEDGGEI